MIKYFSAFFRPLAFALLFVALPLSVYAAGVEYVTVEGKGSAETRARAISEALVEAVSKVNGIKLAAQDVTALQVEIAAVEAQKGSTTVRAAAASVSEVQAKRIASSTKGLVQTYEVTSETPSTLKQGWVDVTVQATIGRYQASEQTQRKRIAVAPFRYRAGAPAYEQRYAASVVQGVVSYLSQTRRFAVLDRNFIQEKHAEFNLLQGDDVPAAEKARVGNTLGADYILVGVVDELKGARTSEKVPYVNEIQFTYTGNARTRWRLIEAPTGMVVLSDTVAEKQIKKIMADNTEAELPGVVALADATAERIGKRIMETIYPPMAVAFNGTSVTIGQGGNTMKVGQRFTLVQYGEILRDPYTKEPLGREEKKVGLIEVTEVLPKTSEAKVIEATLTPEQFKPGQFILREIKEAAPSPKAAPAKTMQPKW